MALTTTASAVDALLRATCDTTLADFLAEQRNQGHSNERTARELYELTEGDISVVGNTIRNWTHDILEVSA